MSEQRRATVIVNNYNYERFLGEAIDSALNQTHVPTEVVVVDDGSSDGSPALIASYGDKVVPVFKKNGGQASAFNAGFRASRGEVVLFLDADDRLLPTAAEEAVAALREPDVVKVHWPLRVIDEQGNETGKLVPGPKLPEGDLREAVLKEGPASDAWPPTTGNACTRAFLESIFPVPEDAYRICADAYLFTLASVCGRIKRIDLALGLYRIHGQNSFRTRSFEDKLRCGMRVYEQQCSELHGYLQKKGVPVSRDRWLANSWWHRLHRAVEEIAGLVPLGERFILVDDDHLGTGDFVGGRRRIPFLEKDGRYWGPAADDATAIHEVERLRQSEIAWIVFAWPAFWWLGHYAGLQEHLRSRFRCALENERLIAFDLGQENRSGD
jgi:hypothetical protein